MKKGESPNPYGTDPPVDPKRYENRWIDLDENHQIVNGLNSIGVIPKKLFAENGLQMLHRCGMWGESLISNRVYFDSIQRDKLKYYPKFEATPICWWNTPNFITSSFESLLFITPQGFHRSDWVNNHFGTTRWDLSNGIHFV
jgi:hypothetical protein